jgi:polar amino acid transport system permease protein
MHYNCNWEILISQPWLGMLIRGMKLTLIIVICTTFTSLIMGVLLLMGRVSKTKWISYPVTFVTEILRNIPGVFWLIIWFYMVPMIFPDAIRSVINDYRHYGLIAAIMGLTFDNSPYVSDIFRSGFLSVNKETVFSAQISGMSKLQTWLKVTLPQAFTNMLPSLNVRFVHNLKNSSLAMVISVPELTWISQEIESITFRGLESTTAATLIYITMAIIFSFIFFQIERRLRRHKKLQSISIGDF